jgi:predicted nucleic acid-binding Zn ribbon protein
MDDNNRVRELRQAQLRVAQSFDRYRQLGDVGDPARLAAWDQYIQEKATYDTLKGESLTHSMQMRQLQRSWEAPAPTARSLDPLPSDFAQWLKEQHKPPEPPEPRPPEPGGR